MTETLKEWLDRLASKEPAPGGGAAAAVSVATGAALISMVCELTLGKPKYAAHEELIKGALARATALRLLALALADIDADAFAAVATAYRLPKATDAQQAQRSAAIQHALTLATEVPVRTASLAAEVITLAASIVDRSNINVISDVAAAAASARAGLEIAAINVRLNLSMLHDEALRQRLAKDLAVNESAIEAAGRVIDAVVKQIGK